MTTGRDPHPEVAEISDFSEGLLAPERARELRAHLDDCDLCRDVLHSLEEIRGLLGTLPGPQRMPADIAGRIDAALAAEALLDSTLSRVPRETSIPDSPPAPTSEAPPEAFPDATPAAASAPTPAAPSSDRPRDVPRGTSTAPTGHPGGSAGPGRGGRPGERSGSRRRRGFLAVASAAAAALLGGVIYASTSGSTSAGSSATLDSARKQAPTVGSAQTVGTQVRELLAGGSATQRPATTGRGTTPMLRPNSTGSVTQPNGSAVAVPSCVLKATHRSQPPLAAERELFRGTESFLVVLPHPSDTTQVDAFVVNASCTAASPGAVLFQGTYPR